MRTGPGWALGPLMVAAAGLQACAPVAAPTAPLFVLEAREAPRYQALAREQEEQLPTCAERRQCDRVHFTRALVALYENRAVAAKHFQDTVAVAPDGRLAAASRLWLRLLNEAQADGGRGDPFARMTDQLVRDLLDREVMIQQLTRESESSAVKALQRGLKARDKQVEELTRQLEALKRIDQEMKEKERSRRKAPSGKGKPLE